MDWLCNFQSVTQVNGQLTKDETLYFAADKEEKKLQPVTEEQYQDLKVP